MGFRIPKNNLVNLMGTCMAQADLTVFERKLEEKLANEPLVDIYKDWVKSLTREISDSKLYSSYVKDRLYLFL